MYFLANPAQALPDSVIFRRVLQATGLGKTTQPTPRLTQLLATNTKVAGAQINEKAQFELNRNLYEVCQSIRNQQDHALAFVIGQQLALYYKNKTLPLIPQYDGEETVLAATLYADKMGIIYAYMAGFPMVNIYEELIKKAYKSHHLEQDALLAKRLARAKQMKAQLKQFFLTFETANLLTMINQHLAATQCYEFILKTYQGREVLNNAGVNSFQVLIERLIVDGYRPEFIYPVTIEGSTDLSRVVQWPSGFEHYKIKQVYDSAARYLRQAIKADPAYAPAYLNLACLQTVRRRWNLAKQNAQKALQLTQKPSLVRRIKAIQAIIMYDEATKGRIKDPDQQKVAADLMHQLKSDDQYDYVYLNWKVMVGRPPGQPKGGEGSDEGRETIAGINLIEGKTRGNDDDYLQATNTAKAQASQWVRLGKGTYIFEEKIKGYFARKIVLVHTGRLIYFLETLPGYKGTTVRGNLQAWHLPTGKQGATWKDLQRSKHYGVPKSASKGVLRSHAYHYKIYHARQIIFQLDLQNRVMGWKLYNEVKN
ncbi:MAG TPA: hypothetical protein DCS93_03315 [Microscillaceae bacterium]|nr:hypothetical protein [Microscillaceae bacterium]